MTIAGAQGTQDAKWLIEKAIIATSDEIRVLNEQRMKGNPDPKQYPVTRFMLNMVINDLTKKEDALRIALGAIESIK